MKNFVLAGLTLVMVMSMTNSSEACFRWGWRRSARISYRMAGYRGHFHRAYRWGYAGGWGGGYRGFYAGFNRGYGGYGGYGGGYGGYGGCYGSVSPSFGGYYATAAPAYGGYYASTTPVCPNGNCSNYGCPNGVCGPAVQSYAGMIPAAPRLSFLQKASQPAVMTASTTPANPGATVESASRKSFLQKYASNASVQPAPKQPIYGSSPVVPNYSYSPAVSLSGCFASLDY
ncbi:MAG: hypothetical protein U0903_00930 [Planctomycetales bacterium]